MTIVPRVSLGDATASRGRTVGIVAGALGDAPQVDALTRLFPQLRFENLGSVVSEEVSKHLDILVIPVNAASVVGAERQISEWSRHFQVIVVLADADVESTRRLVRMGVADVLPTPLSESAIALCLERLVNRMAPVVGAPGRGSEVVAFLKAGGGSGATSLAVHAGAHLARSGVDRLCIADLDIQFGSAGVYLDMLDAVSLTDILGGGPTALDTAFDTALKAHKSGLRLLAAPREVVALEALSPALIDSLMSGLRRDFALSLIDLPSDWTAWTNRVVQQADRIVMVTQLTVPHILLVKRQLNVLAQQKLAEKPLVLVCNNTSAEQLASLSIKAAEQALGRSFDVVVPEDRKAMVSALNQGQELSSIQRGGKLEKAILQMADKVAGRVSAPAPAKRGFW